MANDVVMQCTKCGSGLFQRTRSVTILSLHDAMDAAKKARSNAVAWSKEQNQQCLTMERLALYAVDAVLVYEARVIEEHVKKCGRCYDALALIKSLLNLQFFNGGFFLYEPYMDLHDENIVVCTNCKTRYRADTYGFLEE